MAAATVEALERRTSKAFSLTQASAAGSPSSKKLQAARQMDRTRHEVADDGDSTPSFFVNVQVRRQGWVVARGRW